MSDTSDTATSENEALLTLVRILKSMQSEDRHRLVSAAMMFVGETWAPQRAGPAQQETLKSTASPDVAADDDHRGICLKGQKWMKQVGVKPEELDNLFNFTADSVDLLLPPGKTKKDTTLNTYVLFGLSQYLRSGSLAFADTDARRACADAGCFDQANHAATIKDRGNLFSGDKDAGWTLSAAGLTRAAALIKQHQEPSA